MQKPKTPRREMAMVTLWDILKHQGKTFTKEDFIKAFRDLEKEDNTNPVSFPLGTVEGDVEALLSYLKEVCILEEKDGVYSCTIE